MTGPSEFPPPWRANGMPEGPRLGGAPPLVPQASPACAWPASRPALWGGANTNVSTA